LVKRYMTKLWTDMDTEARIAALTKYGNAANAGMLLQHIWPNL